MDDLDHCSSPQRWPPRPHHSFHRHLHLAIAIAISVSRNREPDEPRSCAIVSMLEEEARYRFQDEANCSDPVDAPTPPANCATYCSQARRPSRRMWAEAQDFCRFRATPAPYLIVVINLRGMCYLSSHLNGSLSIKDVRFSHTLACLELQMFVDPMTTSHRPGLSDL